MSSSNNGNSNGLYPLSLYLSSLSGHQDTIRNPYSHQLGASPGQMVSAVPDSLIDYMTFNSNQKGFRCPEVSREIKKVVKKDRHSKIHTAQGLRDRRVRLSIGIARQFFDLQDMLGFDKASKTLDWLLKKSRKAIKKVVQAKKLNNDDEVFGNNVDEEEEDEEQEEEDDGDENEKSELSNISSKGPRSIDIGKAKETTKDMTYDHPETVSEITQSETMDPFKRSIILNEEEEDMSHSFYKEAIQDIDNQECILTKTKIINLQANMNQSYNRHDVTFMLMDQGFSYNTILPQYLDFDQNPSIDQPFCAATDTNFPRGFP